MFNSRSTIPRIEIGKAPDDERERLSLLNTALSDLENYLKTFNDAVELFDYCIEHDAVINNNMHSAFAAWCFVASRDAVMSVWNFRETMLSANNISTQSKYLSPNLDRFCLKEAHSKFNLYFKDFAEIRHAVAHAGELMKNIDAYKRHSFSGTYINSFVHFKNCKRSMIRNCLYDRKYTCTFEGRVVNCEISAKTTQNLSDVTHLFYRAFANSCREKMLAVLS
jgi:hypothetical protein